MKVYVLIKDYGYEGQTVHGVTESERLAQTWSVGDMQYYIEADTANVPSDEELPTKRYYFHAGKV